MNGSDIYKSYKEDKLSKLYCIHMLQDICTETNSSSERIGCLELISKLVNGEKSYFSFFENVAISDEHVRVRICAIKIIVYSFPKQFIKIKNQFLEYVSTLRIGLALYKAVRSAKYDIDNEFKSMYAEIEHEIKEKLERSGTKIKYLEIMAQQMEKTLRE